MIKKLLFSILLFISLTSPAWCVTYHYVYPGLETGSNDGSDWTNAWKTFAGISWATLQTDAAEQPVYLYIKKGITTSTSLSVGGSGSSDTNRIIITVDPLDTGANPIFQNGDRPIKTNNYDYITISYMTVTGTSTINNAVEVGDGSNYVTIDHILIHDVNTNAIKISGSTNAYTVISNCTIYNIGPSESNTYDGIGGGGTNTSILNNVVYNVCEDSIETGGNNILVDGNEVYNTGWGGAACEASHPDAIVVGAGTNQTIRNNYIYDTYSQGLYIDIIGASTLTGTTLIYNNVFNNVHGGNGAMTIHEDPGECNSVVKIYNNTFYDNPNGTIALYNPKHCTSIDIKNNLMYGNGGGMYIGTDAAPLTTSDYNFLQTSSVWSGTAYSSLLTWQAASGQDTNSEWGTNPLWSNPANGDFTLQFSSPAKNVGVSLVGVFTTDKVGISRPQGAAWDIGAYEYVSSGGAILNPSGAPANLGADGGVVTLGP